MTCAVTIDVGDLVIDCETEDAQGIIWAADLEGWWEAADIDSVRHPLPVGDVLTATRMKAKALLLKGTAALARPHPPLDTLWSTAVRTLNRETRFEFVPGLIVVTDETMALQSLVRRVGQPRVRMLGRRHLVAFEVPLLAEDPRKYSTTQVTNTSALVMTGSSTSDSGSITNNGDQPTAPVITIDEPATNPKVTSTTDDGKYVRYVGALGGGDTLVIDMAAGTVKKNGTLVAYDPLSRFWSLLPGANSLVYERTAGSGTTTAQVVYREAYS